MLSTSTMSTITTEQATHRDTTAAREVSSNLTGKVTTAYARDKHLLMGRAPQVAVQAGGTPVGANATPRQAFAAAGADFTVEKRPIAFGTPLPGHPENEQLFSFGSPASIPGFRAVIRTDTNTALGVMGRDYTPVQNDSLIQLFEFLHEDARLDNIVAINGGRKIFATATIDVQGEVSEGDTIRRYLHAFNSFDGSSGFGVFFSDLRVVCANQLRYISGRGARLARDAGQGLVMRHTRSVEEFAANLPRLINLESARFHQDLTELRPLTAPRSLTSEGARAILEATFADKLAQPIKDKETGKPRARLLADLDNEVAAIRSHAFGETGIGIDTSDRSIWNLFQAITQYETHDTGRATDAVDRARTRLESLWGGTSAKRIERAREACLALV